MSKEEIKNLLIDFICEYDMTSWSNEKVYEKFSDIIYKKFTDLEAKLAVSENTITNLVEDNRASQEWYKKQLAESEEFLVATKLKVQDLNKQLSDTEEQNKRVLEKLDLIVRSNQELEKQLAEKEKEIEKSHLILDKILTEIHTNCYSGLNIVKFKEMVLNDLGGLIITHNQDKISFAVEQLEKVKELILKECFEVSGKGVVVRYYAIYHIFDNQIKQLKEMK